MMDQHGARFIQGLPALAVQTQAQIDIIEGNREVRFIKAAHERLHRRPI